MKLTKNFCLEEFIDKPEFDYFKDKGITGIRLINPKIPTIAQGIRDHFGNRSIIINNWKWGKGRHESGLRVPIHEYFMPYSCHSRGNAIDIVIDGLNSLEVQKEIMKKESYFMALGITMIEKNTIGWTHVSCSWTNKDKIIEV